MLATDTDDESISQSAVCELPLPETHPLKLVLQHTWDVEAEVGAKGQQTVEEEHHKAVVGCEKKNEKLDN